MKLVGLTGGIGSGKSTVGRLLAAHGAHVCDVDQLARDVLAPGKPAVERVRQAFGDEVFAADGSLDRAKLASIVFRDQAALRLLESITHPLISGMLEDWVSSTAASVSSGTLVVVDHPLLIETQHLGRFDAVVVVTCDDTVRRHRLTAFRGLHPDDVNARIAAQISDAERVAHATHVIDNSQDEDSLKAAVAALYSALTATPVGKEGQHNE